MRIATLQKAGSSREPTPPQEINIRRFRPLLALNYQRDLHSLARRIQEMSRSEATDLLNGQIAKVSGYRSSLLLSGLKRRDLDPTTRYVATLQVLRDLLLQGWELRSDDEGLILDSPERALLETRSPNPERQKEGLRRSFSFAREKQLLEPATSRFICSMERRGVNLLFADGTELADRLERASWDLGGVEPELECIEQGARDPTTGLFLQDIWRYARHYWSIPYRSTPGRNMFYLIRDAALPTRPLMGIAALGNPVLNSAPRDEFFGWSVSAFRRYLASRSPEERTRIAKHLYETVAEGLEETYSEDLLPEVWQVDWRRTAKELRNVETRNSRERIGRSLDEDGDENAEHALIRAATS